MDGTATRRRGGTADRDEIAGRRGASDRTPTRAWPPPGPRRETRPIGYATPPADRSAADRHPANPARPSPWRLSEKKPVQMGEKLNVCGAGGEVEISENLLDG